ncbi:cystatin-A5-like [Symphorus nematophorus]
MADIHGGYGETKDATDETQRICDQVKCRVEEKTKTKYVEFKAVKYRDWLNARYGLTLHLLIKVKCRVEEITNKKYVEFKAVKYRNQIVAGKKLSIKVHVGGVNYIHLFVFLALPCDGGKIEVKGVEQHKTKDDPLETF